MPFSFQAKFDGSDVDHQRCTNQVLTQAERLCKQQNKRFTTIRRRVLTLIWSQHKPVGAYQLLDMMRQQARTAPPTVYRALDFLLQLGLVHRIESLNAYVGCTHPGEPHDSMFLICQNCHALAELIIPEISATINQVAAVAGFDMDHQTVEVMGLCPNCRQKNGRE